MSLFTSSPALFTWQYLLLGKQYGFLTCTEISYLKAQGCYCSYKPRFRKKRKKRFCPPVHLPSHAIFHYIIDSIWQEIIAPPLPQPEYYFMSWSCCSHWYHNIWRTSVSLRAAITFSAVNVQNSATPGSWHNRVNGYLP